VFHRVFELFQFRIEKNSLFRDFLIGIRPEENREVVIDQAVNNYSFFQSKQNVSAAAYRVSLSVLVVVIRLFVS
jgi:hypothetical protein